MRAVLGVVALLVAASPAAASPAIDYVLHCQGCHRADGEATARSSIPALIGVARFLHVPGGRAYLVQVPGTAQAPLSDAAIADLLNWLVVRFSQAELPDPFVPYTTEEVAKYRAHPLTDVDEVRAALLAALPD